MLSITPSPYQVGDAGEIRTHRSSQLTARPAAAVTIFATASIIGVRSKIRTYSANDI